LGTFEHSWDKEVVLALMPTKYYVHHGLTVDNKHQLILLGFQQQQFYIITMM